MSPGLLPGSKAVKYFNCREYMSVEQRCVVNRDLRSIGCAHMKHVPIQNSDACGALLWAAMSGDLRSMEVPRCIQRNINVSASCTIIA